MKCANCGERIGMMAVRFTWIDKKNDIAVHDKCLEEYKKKTSEQEEKNNEEKSIQIDDEKIIKNVTKNKALGTILLLINIIIIMSYVVFYSIIGIITGPSGITIILVIVGILLGVELLRSKGERQFIWGIILLVIELIVWLLLPLIIIFAMS